ncbi:regucalcin [Aplysia californica]|uniref:Regucalcin n=1 Tax=Aplysia californica TaxID=6500 RepID=A0ABM1A1X7_APLCA|nr:regucalcin [Aplysia californica]
MKVTAVTPPVDVLGESGHWDTVTSSLLWVNTPGREVKRYQADTGDVTTRSTEEPVSFSVPRSKGQSLVIAQGQRLDFLDEVTGEQTPFAPSTSLKLAENVVTNDGKCDVRGRLWFGTWERSDNPMSSRPVGGLYSVTSSGVVRLQASGFRLTNGLDWTSDNRTFLLADSVARCVYAFDFDQDSGHISRQRTALDLSETGMPDGLTVDAEDKLWVALLGGGRVARFDLSTGKEIQHVDLTPTTGCTCPNFGGKNWDELYVTTTKLFASPEQLKCQPHAGSVYKVTELGVKGKRPFTFAG